ncbi:cobalt-precorrin-6A reductase [Kiloniella laminariae]|uniref:Cobalt-precorrin-6A reductase n=1 Tax=Kiloniella laminariae TaxID=454162 RepID=A0ABT4LHY1_9PROT|nr:cobalt-precorrin-6A reductase [Kiloniella laminariae]MCZ4280713.1 cobalt-precorrin-6A reductase [Kiloniella laminariae]
MKAPPRSSPQLKILILGGVTEANNLAELLEKHNDFIAVTSRAGVTSQRVVISGSERLGGFGGVDGLKNYLTDTSIDAVVDATHPFARNMTENAACACGQLGIPRLILQRPAWKAQKKDLWSYLPDLAGAVNYIKNLPSGRRVFLTTGQQELSAFAALPHHHFIARMIEAPDFESPPANMDILLERGPFSLAQELALMKQYQIDLLVSKNSGGQATEAKLKAAQALAVPVLMIERPPVPAGSHVVETAEQAIEWLEALRKTLTSQEDRP